MLITLALSLYVGSQWAGVRPGTAVDTALIVSALAVAARALAARCPPGSALPLLASAVGAMTGLRLSDMAVGTDRWMVISGTWLVAALPALGVSAVFKQASQPRQKRGRRHRAER